MLLINVKMDMGPSSSIAFALHWRMWLLMVPGERLQIMHSAPKITVARGLPAGSNQGRSMLQDAQGGGLEGLLVVKPLTRSPKMILHMQGLGCDLLPHVTSIESVPMISAFHLCVLEYPCATGGNSSQHLHINLSNKAESTRRSETCSLQQQPLHRGFGQAHDGILAAGDAAYERSHERMLNNQTPSAV